MRQTPRMKPSRFARLHPDLDLETFRVDGGKVFEAHAKPKSRQSYNAREAEHLFFTAEGRTEEAAIAKLSSNILKYNGRKQMVDQDWEDEATGEIQPLQAHHGRFRSHGGNHSQANLHALSLRSHEFQHTKRGSK